MREGGLEAPTRHALDWRNPAFYDAEALDDELRRVFDICHTCRRCFNLCDSFPRLFDLIDESESGELDSVASLGFKPVVDACTLCDMCYMTKCPYVPPHEFNIDFPNLMLRYRAVEHRAGKTGWAQAQLARTDRNGRLARPLARLANWASRRDNRLTRPLLEAVAGVHRDADLPKFYAKTFTSYGAGQGPEINREAPARGRKAVLYATCFVNYNKPLHRPRRARRTGPQRRRYRDRLSNLLRHAPARTRRPRSGRRAGWGGGRRDGRLDRAGL